MVGACGGGRRHPCRSPRHRAGSFANRGRASARPTADPAARRIAHHAGQRAAHPDWRLPENAGPYALTWHRPGGGAPAAASVHALPRRRRHSPAALAGALGRAGRHRLRARLDPGGQSGAAAPCTPLAVGRVPMREQPVGGEPVRSAWPARDGRIDTTALRIGAEHAGAGCQRTGLSARAAGVGLWIRRWLESVAAAGRPVGAVPGRSVSLSGPERRDDAARRAGAAVASRPGAVATEWGNLRCRPAGGTRTGLPAPARQQPDNGVCRYGTGHRPVVRGRAGHRAPRHLHGLRMG